MRLRKESSKGSVVDPRREAPPDFANLTVDLLKPVQHSKRYAITNVDSLGVIERFTYTEITREAARWAQLLREKGLQPGDRVVVVAGREWGWRCALLGAIHAGGVAVPCPASLSLREIRTVAEHAGASLLVALRPRPDLVELDGLPALTADDVDAIDPARALERPPHRTEARDIALILYAWHGLDLTGTMHTHASLLAQADAAEHWLGVNEDERIWATADDGSGPSIWLLLAAWRRAASIVVVDLELDSEAKLELLDRLRPAAVWFSDDEYGMLGSTEVPAWVDLRSIRRAFVDTEETEGASAFVAAFGAALVPVFALDELGVVAGWPAGREGQADAATAHPTPGVQVAVVGGDGTELPPGEVGDIAVRSDAPTLFTGYAGREGRSRSAGWFRFGWRGALTAEGALRVEARSPSEVEPVGASVDLPLPEVAEDPAPEEQVAAEPEPAAIGWRARRSAERARREEEQAAEEERRRREEAEARASAERKAAQAAERERAEAEERREREEAEARERAEREAAAEAQRAEEERLAEERREREEAEARERAERAAAAEAQRAEEERIAEERRVAEQQKRRDEEQRQREEEEARRRAEQEAKQRAAAEADERRSAEAEATQRAEQEKEAREREAREAKEREKAEAEGRRRAEEEAKARQAAAAAEAKQRAEGEKSREKERQREEKEARARAEREAKEREKAEAEARRRAEEEAKIRAKREEAEAKQRAKDEKEREQREAKERAEREKAEAEAAKVQAKIDAAEAKQRAKDEKEREKREAVERVEREKAEAAAAKIQAKIDAAEAKQRAKDEKEREKREAVERAEREKAEAEAAKARQKQAEIDAKKRAEEEKRRAKEREQEEKEARRRAEEEAKEAARAERRAARKEKRRPREAPKPKPADDGQRRFGRRHREVVEEPEPQHAPDVVARIKQYGMAAESNGPAEPPEQPDED